MKTQTQKRNGKKAAVLAALALLLVACVAMGTMAWLTATDELTNTFVVGDFTKPTVPDDHPDPQPGQDDNQNPNISTDGYLIEPSWDTSEEHKLVPGASILKDPYVGIGKGSEDAVVYVYVENPFENDSVYFVLNTTFWKAVDGKATSVSGGPANAYTEGLFEYIPNLEAQADKDVWTEQPVFSQVVVSDEATTADLNITGDKNIVISCFIHQAKDGDGSPIDRESVIKPAAIDALTTQP